MTVELRELRELMALASELGDPDEAVRPVMTEKDREKNRKLVERIDQLFAVAK